MVYGDKGTQANPNEIYALARQAGLQQQDAITATAISLAESTHGITNAWNPVPPDDSLGLWQINMLAHGTAFGTKEQLVNPQRNAAAMYALSRAGANWYPWTTWTGGAYRKFLPEAQQAALNTPDADIGTIVDGLMARSQQTTLPTNPSGRPSPGADPNTPIVPGLPTTPADVGGALAPLSGLAAIAAPFAWLTVPGHWWAIAFVAIGIALVAGGLAMYFRPELEQAAGRIAKAAEAT